MAKIRHEHMSTKQKLLALAKHLKSIPDKNFDMESWCDNKKSCGSAACALGWASTLFYGLKLEDYGPRYKEHEGLDAGAALFGITGQEAQELFLPADYDQQYDEATGRYDAVPKSAVIARIREVAARY